MHLLSWLRHLLADRTTKAKSLRKKLGYLRPFYSALCPIHHNFKYL